MELQKRLLADIKPYWRNPRLNEKAVQAVKRSIENYGFNQPLVIDREGVIIVGHTRYRALLDLGHTEVDVVVSELPAEKAREYRIADNKSGEFAEWDYGKLVAELRTLDNLQDMAPFFQGNDLDEIMRGAGVEDPNAVTRTEVADTAQALNGEMTERSADTQASYVPVTCPGCGEEFHIDRNELARSKDAVARAPGKVATLEVPDA